MAALVYRGRELFLHAMRRLFSSSGSGRLQRIAHSWSLTIFSILAVATSIFQGIQLAVAPPNFDVARVAGTAETLFLFLVLLLATIRWRGSERSVLAAVGTFALGMIARMLPFTFAELLSNALIELALVLVLAYLLVPAVAQIARIRRVIRSVRERTGSHLGAIRGELGMTAAPIAPDLRPALIAGLVISFFLALSTFKQSSWHLVGAQMGSIIWNAHVMGGDFVRDRYALVDPFIGAHSQAVTVAILDSPFLTFLKLLHPGALNGPGIMNVVGVLSVWGVLTAGTLVARAICGNATAASGAMLAFLALPLGFALRFAAPLDLVLPLIMLTYVLSNAPRPGITYIADLSMLLAVMN